MEKKIYKYADARNRAGISVVEAAKQLGVTTDQLREIEGGLKDVDAVLISRMACLYKVSSDYLLDMIS